MDYLAKNKLKKVGLALLSLVVLGASVMGIANLANNLKSEQKIIHPAFNVGGLDTNGEHVDQDTTLYSNEFLAQGLQIKLDFENDIKYQVYYYDEDSEFVKASDVMDGNYNVTKDTRMKDIEFTSARVLIIPQWTNVEATEDKTLEELQVVNWKNKHSFVNQMEIKVSRDQSVDIGEPVVLTIYQEYPEETYTVKLNLGSKQKVTWEKYIKSNPDSDFSIQENPMDPEEMAPAFKGKVFLTSNRQTIDPDDLIDVTMTYIIPD